MSAHYAKVVVTSAPTRAARRARAKAGAVPAIRPRSRRREGEPVLCFSVDLHDIEATRDRRVGDRSYRDQLDYHAAVLELAGERQAESVLDGPARYHGDFGHLGVSILRELLADMRKNGNGLSDLAHSQIAARIGCGVDAVRDAIHDLTNAHFLGYVRRSQPTGAPRRFGIPQRQQISNVTFLTPDLLPLDLRQRLDEKVTAIRERRAQKAARDALRAAVDEKAGEGGMPPRRRQRPPSVLDPAKTNPAMVKRIEDRRRTMKAAEQQTAALVESKKEELIARMRAQCG